MRIRILAASVAMVAVVGVAACASHRGDEQPVPEQVAQRTHHHHGPANLMTEIALEVADLSAEQQAAVALIRDEAQLDDAARDSMREQFRSAAANIVRAGSTDSAEFERALDQATRTIEERMETSSAAVRELHTLLSVPQREAVADALQERLEERWGRSHERRGGHVKKIAAQLMLSAVQLDKLKVLRDQLTSREKRLKPSKAELTALIDAFRGAGFEAALDAFEAEKKVLLRERLSRAGEHTDTALSILNADQRSLLAELIQIGPERTTHDAAQ